MLSKSLFMSAVFLIWVFSATIALEAAPSAVCHVHFNVVTATSTPTPFLTKSATETYSYTPTLTPTPTITLALTISRTCTMTLVFTNTAIPLLTITPTPEQIVSGEYIYVIGPGNMVRIYALADPARLLIVLPKQYLTWHMYIHDQYAYLVDGHGTLEVKEISNPKQPRNISSQSTGGDAFGISGYKTWVLVADGSQGVAFYDASMPEDLRMVKHVYTSLSAQDISINEVVQQAKVLLADGTYQILDLSQLGLVPYLFEGGYATPNPFLPLHGQKAFFNFRFNDPSAAFTIRLYNLRGQLMRTLTNTREWDGRSEAGHLCEGGVYVYQIEAEGRRVSGKVVLIK